MYLTIKYILIDHHFQIHQDLLFPCVLHFFQYRQLLIRIQWIPLQEESHPIFCCEYRKRMQQFYHPHSRVLDGELSWIEAIRSLIKKFAFFMINRTFRSEEFTFITFLELLITYKYFKAITKLIYPVITY